ncbi:hypothetical protein [Patulibacter minatonensis]|uniref:hypothetical protein n=1 Tax=Patulibacter minatonensis TaxID=298163 RepID=UPI00047E65B1|nr:hypothetical protein [Patulibacter minatonensis]
MTDDLVTWKRVPIAAVGNHQTSVGDGGITIDDLNDAVAAQGDPAVKTARTILGHSFRQDGDHIRLLDRAVIGRTQNLQVDGDTLYADITVPPNIDRIAATAFPSRSIEAIRNVKTDTGDYRMVVTGLALLSDELPAVETLEDLEDLWARNDTAAPSPTADAPLVAASRLVAFSTPSPDDDNAAPAVTTPDPLEGPNMADTQPEKTPETTDAPENKTDDTTATTDAPKVDEQPKADEPKVDTPDYTPPAGFKLISEDQEADINARLKRFDEFMDRKAQTDAETFASELVAAGKIAPKSKDKVVADYKENPQLTRGIFDHVAATIPVGQLATFSRQPHDEQPTDELLPSIVQFTAAEQARIDTLTKGA